MKVGGQITRRGVGVATHPSDRRPSLIRNPAAVVRVAMQGGPLGMRRLPNILVDVDFRPKLWTSKRRLVLHLVLKVVQPERRPVPPPARPFGPRLKVTVRPGAHRRSAVQMNRVELHLAVALRPPGGEAEQPVRNLVVLGAWVSEIPGGLPLGQVQAR